MLAVTYPAALTKWVPTRNYERYFLQPDSMPNKLIVTIIYFDSACSEADSWTSAIIKTDDFHLITAVFLNQIIILIDRSKRNYLFLSSGISWSRHSRESICVCTHINPQCVGIKWGSPIVDYGTILNINLCLLTT